MIKLNFDVKKHKLENGLEVLTIKKDTQISSINVGIKVGSLNESKDEKGISHFCPYCHGNYGYCLPVSVCHYAYVINYR